MQAKELHTTAQYEPFLVRHLKALHGRILKVLRHSVSFNESDVSVYVRALLPTRFKERGERRVIF